MGGRDRRTVALIDEDPGLAVRLTSAERVAARAVLRAEVVDLGRGEHDLSDVTRPDLLVALVLEGWMLRNVTVGGRRSAMLVGRGTVGRPGDDFGFGGAIPHSVSWSIVEPTRLALLEASALPMLGRWPGLAYTMTRRAFERYYLLTLVAAIRGLQHVELRLRALMWLYAGRYGRAMRDGMQLPVRLSHQQLADLVGSQRPSVSAHLAALSSRNEIVRCPDRTWLVRGDPPRVLDDLRVRADAPDAVE